MLDFRTLLTRKMKSLRPSTRGPARRCERTTIAPSLFRGCFETLESRRVLSLQAPIISDATPYNSAFVSAVYEDALGRAADPTALTNAVLQLNAGQLRTWLPALVVGSDEYLRNTIVAAYQQYLGREVDTASLNFWMGKLQGGTRDEELDAALVGSDEFYLRNGGTNAAWIEAAYQKLLGRPADSGALTWATDQLSSSVSRGELALKLAMSIEHEETVARSDFEHYWKTTVDDQSVNYWAAHFATGQATNESLVMTLLDTNQYYEEVTGVSPTVVPEPVPNATWDNKNAAIDSHAAAGNAQVVFIGDSITDYWQTTGLSVWNQNYAGMNALDAGVGGDQTQNVLWRLDHGNLGSNTPQVAVLMLGINNLGQGDSPLETAEGVASVVATLRDLLPTTKILVLGVLPAFADSPDNWFRQQIDQTNQLIQGLADNQNVFYLDMGPEFTNPNGTINANLFQQYLVHPNQQGYEVWVQTMAPYLDAIMALSASQKNLL